MSFTKPTKPTTSENAASTRCQECALIIQSILDKRSEKLAKVYANKKGEYTSQEKKVKVSDVYQKYGHKMKKVMAEKEEQGHVCYVCHEDEEDEEDEEEDEEEEDEDEEEEDEEEEDDEDDEDYEPSEEDDEDDDEEDEEEDEECECVCDEECNCYASEADASEADASEADASEAEKHFGCEGCNYEWRDGFKAGWVKAMNYIYNKTTKAIPKTYVCSNCNVMGDSTKKCGGTCGGVVRYCSKKCQTEHWSGGMRGHKNVCNKN